MTDKLQGTHRWIDEEVPELTPEQRERLLQWWEHRGHGVYWWSTEHSEARPYIPLLDECKPNT